MSQSETIYQRYLAAWNAYGAACAADPSKWHRPDVAEFTELRRLLTPHAESGDMLCQYALASISWMGLCCESEDQFVAGHGAALVVATRWWIESAKQGYWPALDNLVTSGVGGEAQRAKAASKQLECERGDLVGTSGNMPVYGPEFMQELSRRIYGRVAMSQ